MKNKFIGAITAAAAIAFVTAPITSSLAQAKSHAKVECSGVNSCKGKSACKTAENGCKGKNACKGKGVKMMTAAKCKKHGGTVVEKAAEPAAKPAQ